VFFNRKYRLIALVSSVLFVSFIAVSIFNYTAAKKSVREEIVTSSLPLLRENIYSEIKRALTPAINVASFMSNDSFLKNWALAGEEDTDALFQYLREIRRKYGYFSTFFISEATDNYYHYSGILKKIHPENEHDVWYYRFTDSGKPFELDVDTNEAAENRLTIFVNFRLEDFEGNLLGVTGVGLEMENFSGLLEEKQDKYSRRIFLTDHRGTIQAHPDENYIETVNIFREEGIKDVADTLLSKTTEPVNASYRAHHDRVLITSRYISEIDWFLFVEQDESEALATPRRSLWRTVLIGFLTSTVIVTLTGVSIHRYQKRLEKIAVTDELTGVANRREFEAQFRIAESRYRRHRLPLSLLLIDLDNFKEINDSEGHIRGDSLLREVSELIGENIRPEDCLARWGGDEFIVLLSGGLREAEATAKRLTEFISSKVFSTSGRKLSVTVSMGVAEYSEGDTLDSLTNRADTFLYRAKSAGRNTVVGES
jgi:diguanylate cyclase (GGDEF)-like protein